MRADLAGQPAQLACLSACHLAARVACSHLDCTAARQSGELACTLTDVPQLERRLTCACTWPRLRAVPGSPPG